MSWIGQRNARFAVTRKGNTLGAARKGKRFALTGASQTGGAGLSGDFLADQAAVLALDPLAYSVPSGATHVRDGVTHTTTYTTPLHGPEVGLLSRMRERGTASGAKVLTHSLAGSAIATYLATEMALTIAEWTAAFGSEPPNVWFYIISSTDGSGATIADVLHNALSKLENMAHQAWGTDIAVVLTGTINTIIGEAPNYADARATGRTFCRSMTGLRAYLEVDDTNWIHQPGDQHLTTLGEFRLGRDLHDVIERGGLIG